MDTKRPPKSNSNLNKDVVFATPSRFVPMRGMTLFEKPSGRKRFFVRWRDGSKRRAKGFVSDEQRKKFARSLMRAKNDIGKQALSFNAAEWENYLRCKDVVGAVDLLTVCREWLGFRRGDTAGTMPVAEAIERYLAAYAPTAGERMAYRKGFILAEWRKHAGALALRDVAPDVVRAWLASLASRDKLAPQTLAYRRKTVSSFFAWCIREGLCERNPCAAVAPPKIIIEEVSVMPVADAQKLFAVNAREPVASRMALEAFGGLRFSHAARIELAEIDFTRRGIILAAHKHKSRRRGYLEGLPDNLWKWLETAPTGTWARPLSSSQYMHEKSAAFARAGVKNPGNVLRHSFGSYYLALTDDAPKTAAKMQHTSPAMLYRHYKGVASQADARAWFAIVPP